MIVISSIFEEYRDVFDKLGLNYSFHDFSKPLDIEVWQPKVIILSAQTTDLFALPTLAKKDSFVRMILFTEKTAIRIGDSIDYIITIGNAKMEQKQELNLTLDEFKQGSALKTLLEKFTKAHRLLPDSIYIIGATYRPGVATFFTKLEHENYIDNDLFDLFIVTYAGNRYIVAGVPLKDKKICYIEANQCGLRLVNGKPRTNVVDEHFPLSYSEDCIYTLESIKPMPQSRKHLEKTIKEELYQLKCYLNNK